MPLNKPKLIADIVTAQEKAHQAKFNTDGRAIFAQELATAIDFFIKSGDVQTTTTGLGIVAPGIATAGSQYAQVTISPGTSTTSGTGVGKVV
tara:strand:+ start:484 stop:759 length:276 start_codon:yes stop_codon:yes gene_type:complete